MRRHDREITDRETMFDIMNRCDVCRLALNTGVGFPYIIPLNYGLAGTPEEPVLLFHSAPAGTKLDLIRKDRRASFEMDCCRELILTDNADGTQMCSMTYQSVIGQGYIEFIEDPEEKIAALDLLVRRYRPEGINFSREVAMRTCVFRLKVKEMTAKQRPKK
ncbi:MAG: pyridoxamine 5'-phosphate oxidase family protein [Lachnospiraceae bacterium]|nr:pyridoxamine 5'-phosphate oxidase family protein [Lachnospiraceae bacterium]